jgi:uncharacterized protein YkwD
MITWMTIVAALGTAFGGSFGDGAGPGARADGRSAGGDDSALEAAVLAVHNRERAERMLKPFVLEPRLTAAARAHADDMASRRVMAHEGGDGSEPADRVRRQGYVYLSTGENVARGQESVASVMKSWMNSPHHREQILGDFTEIGVARSLDREGEPYWCVEFGQPFPRLEADQAERDLAERINHLRGDSDHGELKVSRALSAAARQIAGDSALKIEAKEKAEKAAKDAEAAKTAAAASAPAKKPAPRPDDASRPEPLERVKKAGYRYTKISLTGTFGTPTPEATLKALLASPEQKAVLTGAAYTELGVGYALSDDGRPAWCIILARPAR